MEWEHNTTTVAQVMYLPERDCTAATLFSFLENQKDYFLDYFRLKPIQAELLQDQISLFHRLTAINIAWSLLCSQRNYSSRE